MPARHAWWTPLRATGLALALALALLAYQEKVNKQR